ncbi:MAG TPA: sulfurtransferase TusA family protein [Patescibacteria group bacterium]|nr:sulfurtransferase TusA family protein [Patescibacteria group bacterium]
MANVLDLRGLSCPIPLLRTKEALPSAGALTVLVDEEPARENIMKFVRSQGLAAECREKDGDYEISIARP